MTQYKYNSSDLVKPIDLNEREQFLLTESKTFCIYPWIHLHAYPTGEAYPCCHAEMGVGQVGNCRTNTLEEIWHDQPMINLRNDMLSETKNTACARCYEQEESGFLQLNISEELILLIIDLTCTGKTNRKRSRLHVCKMFKY